jgi:O-antigen ligase
MLKILSLYVMVVHLVDTPKKFRILVWWYALLVFYLDAVSLVNYYTGKGAFAQGIDRATGATSAAGNANELGTTLACTFPLFLLLALRESAPWRRILAGGLGAAALWGMVLTGSRASLLGFLGGLIYLWWRSGKRVVLGVAGVAVIVAGYFAIPDQYQGRYQTIGTSHLDESSQARVITWLTGLQMVADRPLFGVGAGCFGVARAMAYSPESHRVWLESHSLYVQVLTELGLVGAAAFFLFVSRFLRLNRRVAARLAALPRRWRVERAVIEGIFGGLVVLLVAGVFGHSLYRRTWYLYAGLGLAMWRILHDVRFAPAVERAPDQDAR